MIKYLLIFLLPLVAFAENKPVKKELAILVEESAKATNLGFNVANMTETSLNINQIQGMDVCSPEAKENVLLLQKTFAGHRYLRQTISTYGVYVRKLSGVVKYLDSTDPKIKEMIGECKYLYVSVY